jgi:hypothetical protein
LTSTTNVVAATAAWMLWTTRVLPRASELREIVGDISEIETFAPGSGIRELASEGSMDATVGGSARELLVFGWLMTLSSWLKYIGMKPRESDAQDQAVPLRSSYAKSTI